MSELAARAALQRRFDVRYDAQRTATHATVFDVDVEDALEPLHPAHGSPTRRMRLAGGLVDRVGDDAVAVLAVRGEHAVVSGEMGTGAWHEGGEARQRERGFVIHNPPGSWDAVVRVREEMGVGSGCGLLRVRSDGTPSAATPRCAESCPMALK